MPSPSPSQKVQQMMDEIMAAHKTAEKSDVDPELLKRIGAISQAFKAGVMPTGVPEALDNLRALAAFRTAKGLPPVMVQAPDGTSVPLELPTDGKPLNFLPAVRNYKALVAAALPPAQPSAQPAVQPKAQKPVAPGDPFASIKQTVQDVAGAPTPPIKEAADAVR